MINAITNVLLEIFNENDETTRRRHQQRRGKKTNAERFFLLIRFNANEIVEILSLIVSSHSNE